MPRLDDKVIKDEIYSIIEKNLKLIDKNSDSKRIYSISKDEIIKETVEVIKKKFGKTVSKQRIKKNIDKMVEDGEIVEAKSELIFYYIPDYGKGVNSFIHKMKFVSLKKKVRDMVFRYLLGFLGTLSIIKFLLSVNASDYLINISTLDGFSIIIFYGYVVPTLIGLVLYDGTIWFLNHLYSYMKNKDKLRVISIAFALIVYALLYYVNLPKYILKPIDALIPVFLGIMISNIIDKIKKRGGKNE